jgi:hypothetical protein
LRHGRALSEPDCLRAARARLADIIERVNGLFEGEITDDDQN